MVEIKITNSSKLIALYKNIFPAGEDFSINLCGADILALKFNISEISEIKKSKELLKLCADKIDLPIMICGTGKEDIDKILLPELICELNKECIISYATERTYKDILPSVIEGGHYIVLKTPIDINLAKELNILALDMGCSMDKIMMNTDIGGLGYGYEYGYSIIEKIKLESKKGDKFLDFPIISEAAIESAKIKEAKISQKNAKMIELAAVSGALAAGANIVPVLYEENLKIIKGLL